MQALDPSGVVDRTAYDRDRAIDVRKGLGVAGHRWKLGQASMAPIAAESEVSLVMSPHIATTSQEPPAALRFRDTPMTGEREPFPAAHSALAHPRCTARTAQEQAFREILSTCRDEAPPGRSDIHAAAVDRSRSRSPEAGRRKARKRVSQRLQRRVPSKA